jgi:hypothetical protein
MRSKALQTDMQGWYGYVEYTEKSKKNVKVVG